MDIVQNQKNLTLHFDNLSPDWRDVTCTSQPYSCSKMTPLQEWILLYLEPRRFGGDTLAPWRDGHLYTEALNKIFPAWFDKIR